MKLKLLLTLVVCVVGFSQANAANIEAGKSKVAVCAGCHGPEGISFIPNYPNLKGQKSAYLLKQLKDFKSGVRKDMVMSGLTTNLTDEDMANISAYYESLK